MANHLISFKLIDWEELRNSFKTPEIKLERIRGATSLEGWLTLTPAFYKETLNGYEMEKDNLPFIFT